MERLVEFPLEGGGVVLVAVASDIGEAPVLRGGRGTAEGSLVEKADLSLQAAVAKAAPAAQSVIDTMRNLVHRPDEVTVTFGLELSGKAGGFIASASTKANFVVTLAW